jgi:hypothetical protein
MHCGYVDFNDAISAMLCQWVGGLTRIDINMYTYAGEQLGYTEYM